MSDSTINIAVTGAAGRMGRQLITLMQHTQGVRLSAALEPAGSVWIGADAGELAGIGFLGIRISDDLLAVIDDFELLIDFTRPEGTLKYLACCRQYQKNMVIGTTGFDDAGKAAIDAASTDIAIVFSANFSPGINVVLKLLEKITHAMGKDADIDIIEAHHRNKADAPSGTALAMGTLIAKTLDRDLKQCAVYAKTNDMQERCPGSIVFTSIRAGDIVGEHTVMFTDTNERIEITHTASSRAIFAKGAVRAAIWLSGKKTGLFDMSDVLNLKDR